MNKRKIFNDPVYGFIRFPFDTIYDVINHPYFQRLRRISQLGLTQYVYPGALHTRFHHALGATHLMLKAIYTLREKKIAITNDEAEAACLSILLHDIGHGPFSHALEHKIIDCSHEQLSLLIMKLLDREFGGALGGAIEIFENKYPKKYLCQLVSSQLDMDRMDYLNRDSFFTGVAEGIIGYDRIIKMFNVADDQLVIEEKAIYSIEKFLLARRIMYWQVYLHKTVLAIERMLILFFQRLKKTRNSAIPGNICKQLSYFIRNELKQEDMDENKLKIYTSIDDIDVSFLFKALSDSQDFILNYISNALLNRNLFRIQIEKSPISREKVNTTIQITSKKMNIDISIARQLVSVGKVSNLAYNPEQNEILVLRKNSEILPFSDVTDYPIDVGTIEKFYLCYPRFE